MTESSGSDPEVAASWWKRWSAAVGRWPGWLRVGLTFALLVALVAVLSLVHGFYSDWRKESGAREACEGYVKDSLRSPASAEFSGADLQRRGEYGYVVSGAVDSQNGFGAMIRNRYVCQVSELGDGWLLIDLTFDGSG